MTVQPPKVTEDNQVDSWSRNVTDDVNLLEQRVNALLAAIREATDLVDLQARARNIR